MSATRIPILLLGVAIVGSQAWAQSGANRPIELTIRDYQGKLVTVPPGNPAWPFNYVKWLNETMSKGITDNAADVYREAFKLHKDTEVKDEDLDKALAGPWEHLPSVSAWLKANQPALDKFRQATLKRQCYFPLMVYEPDPDDRDPTEGWPANPEILISACLPDLSSHRNICKALIAEGWQEWRPGHEERLLENSLTILRAARHLNDQITLIHNLAGTAGRAMSYDALRKAVALAHDPDALAGRLAKELIAGVDPPLNLRQLRSLSVEFIVFRDMYQRFFQAGGKPGTWKVRKGLQAELSEADSKLNSMDPNSTRLPADFAEELERVGYDATVLETRELARWSQAWAEKPWPEVARGSASLTAKIGSSGNPLIRFMLSDVTRARELLERSVADRRALHLIVQLHVCHAKTHAFPARLDGLRTPELKEIRIDPFSGQDFVYKKQGKNFVLYSVAGNLKDDGGQHDKSWKEGDFVFWPVQKEAE